MVVEVKFYEDEITPEMIEAGVNAVDPLDRDLLTLHEQVCLIWSEMERVRRSSL